MDRRILATCSGILEKFVFVSMKNGPNWCEHVRDISFEPFTSKTIKRRKNRLQSSFFSWTEHVHTKQFGKRRPTKYSRHHTVREHQTFQTAWSDCSMVSFIHSQIAWNCMGPSTCLLAVMWECGRRCGSGIEIKTSSKSKAITSLIYRVPRIVDPFRSQISWRYSLLWQKVGRPNAMYPIIRKRNTPSTSGVYLTFGM